MTALPHDMTDLYLAPVLLSVEERMEEFATLAPEDFARRVALFSDLPDDTAQLRNVALLKAVGYMLELHDWQLSWDPRGLRVEHNGHAVVLGIPACFTDYITG
jgi:hypothetical protein